MASPVLQMRVPAELRLDVPRPTSPPPTPAVSAGQVSEFERQLGEHRDALTRFVRGRVNACDVDDIVQETLVRAFAQLQDFRCEAKLSTWLFAIARNVCADHHRRSARRREDHLLASSGASGRFTAPLERIADPTGAGADRDAMDAEIRDRMLAEVDSLPEHLRSVFVMRVLHGLRFSEIAETLGEGIPTVKSRMRYAVENLRGQVADLQTWLTGCMLAVEA